MTLVSSRKRKGALLKYNVARLSCLPGFESKVHWNLEYSGPSQNLKTLEVEVWNSDFGVIGIENSHSLQLVDYNIFLGYKIIR